MMALRRCNALRNAALLALRWYVDTMPQAPLLRCCNHFFSRSRGPLLPARICHSSGMDMIIIKIVMTILQLSTCGWQLG